MQTDLVKMKNLFQELGIEYDTQTDEEARTICLTLEVNGAGKVQGYSGFYASFEFDSVGKFKEVQLGE